MSNRLPRGVRIRYAIAVVISIVASYGAWEAHLASDQVSNDERYTCQIQAQGLPAGHELAASMRDIHTLLTFPPSPGAAPVPTAIERVVQSLNSHLAAYLTAEAKQPGGRRC